MFTTHETRPIALRKRTCLCLGSLPLALLSACGDNPAASAVDSTSTSPASSAEGETDRPSGTTGAAPVDDPDRETGSPEGDPTGSRTQDECSTPTDCPDTGNECVVRICLDHRCGTLTAAYGTPVASQTDGDCAHTVCDGNGGQTTVRDPNDLVHDPNDCTIDACTDGSATHLPLPEGASCSSRGGTMCDGRGSCVECLTTQDCALGVCDSGQCVPPGCVDDLENGAETDVDCGGPSCKACATAASCSIATDCASRLCVAGVCAATAPILTSVSATGHDRFFNLTFDAQGNILAVGVVSPGTATTDDFATVVTRFSPQGVLDTSFGQGGASIHNLAVGTNGELARGIALQSTGNIVVSATIEHPGAADARDRDVALLRLKPDGTKDALFGAGGTVIANLSDGQLVDTRYLADSAWHLVVQPDDKIVLSGSQLRPGGTDTDFVLVRFLPDGALDPAFGTNGKVTVDLDNQSASARGVRLLPDGSLVASGYASLGGVVSPFVYNVDSAGALVPTFGTGGIFHAPVLASATEAYAIDLQGAKLVTLGYGRATSTESLDWLSLRMLPNGTLDPTYGVNGLARLDFAGFNDNGRSLTVLPDGRVVLVGNARPTANNVDGGLAVLLPNGQPDTGFSPTGTQYYDLGGPADALWATALAPSGEYLALVGTKGVGTDNPGHDDAALVLVPLP